MGSQVTCKCNATTHQYNYPKAPYKSNDCSKGKLKKLLPKVKKPTQLKGREM